MRVERTSDDAAAPLGPPPAAAPSRSAATGLLDRRGGGRSIGVGGNGTARGRAALLPHTNSRAIGAITEPLVPKGRARFAARRDRSGGNSVGVAAAALGRRRIAVHG